MIDYNGAYTKSLEYFNGDMIAADTWVKKYALQDRSGNFLEKTPSDMHRRLAREFARIELKYKNPLSENEIFELLDGFKFVVPQGSPMCGIGNSHSIQSLSNCFVVDSPYDSYGGIMLTDQEQAQIMKRRGGVGFDISKIRPRGLPTENAAATTDGIGVFMERFSDTCREVAQGGRRGALMLSIDCHHPEIRTFANIKRDKTKVTGANVSIRISDEFMKAVKEGRDVQLRWPVDSDKPEVEVWEDARELWNDITSAARDCSEPGLLFWDTLKRMTPADAYASEGFDTQSTNPCGELPLAPYDSCRLMVINLTNFIRHPFTGRARFDWRHYGDVVMKAQRLMDDLIDLELEEVDRIFEKIAADPEPDHVKRIELDLWAKIKKQAMRGRRTGLGVTGVGDVIAMMGHRYGDTGSVQFVEKLYKNLALNSYKSSIQLAEERGAFDVWSSEKDEGNEFLKRILGALDDEWIDKWMKHGRRNIANTTTAPCGSVSICTQTTSGIEPVIFPTYIRKKKINPDDPGVRVDSVDKMGDSWMHFNVAHHGLIAWMQVNGWQDDAIDDWLESGADISTDEFAGCPYLNATAMEIDWLEKTRLQGAAQKWVCHAISNTYNLPKDVPVETVRELYMAGYNEGCKGITIYREGSRDGVLIRNDKQNEVFKDHHAPKRHEELPCDIHRVTIKGEEWTIFVGLMDSRPYEVFGGLSELVEIPKKYTTGKIIKRPFKQGGKYDLYYGDDEDPHKVKDLVRVFDNPNYSAFTRMLSLSMRHGAPSQYIVEQLQRDKEADLFSFAKVMARTLKKYIIDGTKSSQACWECGTSDSLFYQEGCVTCATCGASKCG